MKITKAKISNHKIGIFVIDMTDSVKDLRMMILQFWFKTGIFNFITIIGFK